MEMGRPSLQCLAGSYACSSRANLGIWEISNFSNCFFNRCAVWYRGISPALFTFHLLHTCSNIQMDQLLAELQGHIQTFDGESRANLQADILHIATDCRWLGGHHFGTALTETWWQLKWWDKVTYELRDCNNEHIEMWSVCNRHRSEMPVRLWWTEFWDKAWKERKECHVQI